MAAKNKEPAGSISLPVLKLVRADRIVGGLLGNVDVVGVRLLQTSGGNLHKLGL